MALSGSSGFKELGAREAETVAVLWRSTLLGVTI